MSVITLLSDFGYQDNYVAVIKGVILSRCRDSPPILVDITHSISPQDIFRTSLLVKDTQEYFPPNTIHFVLVDSGVDVGRRAVILQSKSNQFFVGPDNGVFSHLIQSEQVKAAFVCDQKELFLEQVGENFAGRDVFAPIASRLAQGISIESLGSPIAIHSLITIEIPSPGLEYDSQGKLVQITGEIVYIDSFGNLFSNVSSSLLKQVDSKSVVVTLEDLILYGIKNAFSEVRVGETLCYFGSSDSIEFAIRNGNAAQTLGTTKGQGVSISMP